MTLNFFGCLFPICCQIVSNEETIRTDITSNYTVDPGNVWNRQSGRQPPEGWPLAAWPQWKLDTYTNELDTN